MLQYIPQGVCSRQINVELDGDTIKSVEFIGGCAGNTQGVARLVQGMNVDEAISRIEGIQCGLNSGYNGKERVTTVPSLSVLFFLFFLCVH